MVWLFKRKNRTTDSFYLLLVPNRMAEKYRMIWEEGY